MSEKRKFVCLIWTEMKRMITSQIKAWRIQVTASQSTQDIILAPHGTELSEFRPLTWMLKPRLLAKIILGDDNLNICKRMTIIYLSWCLHRISQRLFLTRRRRWSNMRIRGRIMGSFRGQRKKFKSSRTVFWFQGWLTTKNKLEVINLCLSILLLIARELTSLSLLKYGNPLSATRNPNFELRTLWLLVKPQI